jgi:hypothetical protein
MNPTPHDLDHLTEIEKLWVTHDPEFHLYKDAFTQLRERSAAAPEFDFVLRRVFPIITPCDHDEFDIIPYAKWADAQTAFTSGNEFLAIARKGIIIACKR